MNNGKFRCPCISSPPPLDHHAPLPMSPGGHYQHCVILTVTIHQPPDHQSLLLLESLTEAFNLQRRRRQGERVSGTDDGAAVSNNNKQTYLTIILQALQHQNGSINLPCHVPVGKWNDMKRSVLDVLAVQNKETRKPQLTMLGPLHSKSNALSNNLATQMCERDEEG